MSRTLVVGSYLLQSTPAHLPNLEEALVRFQGQYPIVLVDINVDLDYVQNPRRQLAADLLKEFGLIYLMHHFY